MLWAWAIFKTRGTPLLPSARPTSLVEAGPFRVTRNPMYLGMVLLLSSPAFFTGDQFLYISPLAFFLTINGVYVPHEEATLQGVFGQGYLDYKARVRRWL
jgi:protein-S-isoprenylcysteine O-methyltransferase Ste14